MADFNLSGVVTLEDQGAVATGQNLERTIDGIADAERRAASAAGTLGTATGEAANALRGEAGAADAAAGGLRKTESAAISNARAQQLQAKATAQSRAALTQMNFQIQDISMGAALGVSPFVILAQQGGQFFDALQNLLGAQTASAAAMKTEGAAATTLAADLTNTNRAATTLENKTVQLAAADVAATSTMAGLTTATTSNAVALDADAIAAGMAAGAQLELALADNEGTAAMGANTGATTANSAAKEANAIASGMAAGTQLELALAGGAAGAGMGTATGATVANTAAVEANAIAAGTAGVAQGRFAAAAMGVARFMATGWGAALIAAASIAGMFAMKIGEGSDAMKLAEVGADALGQAQGVLGGMFDLTSGKIEHQNALLVANARLTAINLRADAMQKRRSAGETFKDMESGGGGVTGAMRRFMQWSSGRGAAAAGARDDVVGKHLRAIRGAKTPDERAKAIERALRQTEFREAAERETDVVENLTGVSSTRWRQGLIDIATAEQNDNIASLIDKSLDSGTLAAGLRRDGTRKKPPKPKKPKSTAPLEEFGEDAADKIANIAARFSGQPKLIEQAAAAMRQLDDLVDDINRKKPPNLKVLLADAEKAREAIREGVNRPYNDFILAQNDALRIQQLISQGRNDEAEALRQVLSLEQQMGPLTPERKDAVLATVQALRAEQRETAILQEQQQKYLTALGGLKDAVYDVIRDPIEGLKNLPERLIGAFATLKADKLFEEMFGSTFREIEDSITGAKVAEDAAERMAGAVDEVSDQTNRTTDALGSLAQAATNAASAVAGGVGTGDRMSDLAGAVGGLGDDGGAAADGFFDRLAGELGAAGVNPTATAGVPNAARDEDIVVTGSKSPTQSFSGWIEKLSRSVGIGASQKDRDAQIADALKNGVKVGDDAASKIGKFAGKGIEGAATGAMVNSFLAPLGKALGFKTSAMGAQIGGAVGSFIPIPFGKEIGAVVGSLAGGLMKTTKSGSASISSVYDPASASGNSKAMREASSAAATNIQDSILNIAEALGGELGAFSVSIGQRDGKWRVDPSGKGKTKKSAGALDFGDDSSAAMAAAVMDAIKDGAVTGLSPAISQALKSSTDIDRALREALKVRDLEELIGGLGSTLERQFNDFDRVAEERVRLAKKYGLDLLAVERINGEQRAKLIDDLIKSRIGSLIDFQNEMKFGDLFEGDAPTRRSAIMEEIGKVQPKAEAGDEGAADQLADLYRRLISTSEEAFGTAGPELSADRESAAAAIARVIELENERITAAAGEQAAQTAELVKNNTLTNETNGLLSIAINRLEEMSGKLGGGGGGVADYSGGNDFAKLVRATELALP